jgi:hypothetical protein
MLSPRENWISPGTYAVFFFGEDGKTAYAEVLRPTPGEPGYFQCKVHVEGEPTDVFDVHVTKFVYKLSRPQFTTAWYSGFPDHPRRLQAIVNLVKGGDA